MCSHVLMTRVYMFDCNFWTCCGFNSDLILALNQGQLLTFNELLDNTNIKIMIYECCTFGIKLYENKVLLLDPGWDSQTFKI